MASKEKVLVIIPARGGSKRITKKNIRVINGKPMIKWVIDKIKNCEFISDIIVSTDCDEIKKCVEDLGISVPFKRPKRLSDDFTPTSAVIKHALQWYQKNISKVEYVITIYPTAVMISVDDLKEAYYRMKEEKYDIIFSATSFPFPIQRAFYLDTKGIIKMFQPDMFDKRSQDLTKAYHDAGQFYFSKVEAVLNEAPAFSKNASIIFVPRHRVVDIDTEEDLVLAEKLLNNF